MNSKIALRAAIAAAVVAGSSAVTPLLAQDNNSDAAGASLEEIIVTARKTEESLLEIPLSISAFGAQDIQDLGLNNINDLQLYTPGFSYESFASIPGRFDQSPRFRGVTVNSFDPFRQTGSVFVDGVFVINAASGIGLTELERIEVIKGPQSAFFGRNTFAGAINYITKTPGDEFAGELSASVASRDDFQVAGSIEGPITDTLSGRLSLSYRDKTGHYENSVNGDDLGDEETTSITGSVYFQPNDRFNAKLRFNYFENDDGIAPSLNIGQAFANCGEGTNRPLGGNRAAICGDLPVSAAIDSGLPGQTSSLGLLDPAIQANVGLALDALSVVAGAPNDFGLLREGVNGGFQFDYELSDNITLSGTTGFSEEEVGLLLDPDYSPSDFYLSYNGRKFEMFSQELRLSGTAVSDRLYWSIGYNYLDQELRTRGGFLDAASGGGFFGSPFRAGAIDERTIENNAVFGSLSFDLTDRTTLGFEARYQEEEVTDDNDINDPGAPLEATFDNFLPRLLIDHKLTDTTLLYASWSIGNLAGGFNSGFSSLTDEQRAEALAINPSLVNTFVEEELTQFEIGIKHGFDNGSISVALFDIQRDDVANRFTIALPQTNNGRTFSAFINNGDSDFQGIEIEADYQFSDNFTVDATVGYVDAEFGPFNSPNALRTTGSLEVQGNTPPRFPGLTASLSLAGGGQFNTSTDWFWRLDNAYIGETDLDDANFTTLEADIISNLRAGLKFGNTTVEAFVTNLTDSDRPSGAGESSDISVTFFDFTRPGNLVTLRDRRQFGVRVNYAF